jgi:predicted transcriptional regulator
MASKKVTVNLPDDQVAFLQQLAEKEHITFTDALRRAINSEKFFVQQESSGRKVLVEEQDKRIREVVRK